MDTRQEMVEVPGARLHTERAGTGPALVLIPGGGGDAAMYEDVVPRLADRFTVITYDRRGNSRSPLASPDASIAVSRQAADVVAILDHYGVERAFVFGNSSGAIIALDVLARHAGRLLGAVVHEPPLVRVLPESPDSPEERAMAELLRMVEQEGVMQAFAGFSAMILPDPPKLFSSRAGRAVTAGAMRVFTGGAALARGITGRQPGGMTRLVGNTEILLRRELPAFLYEYDPDLAALEAVTAPWCFATGRDSVGRPYHRPAHVLSERLGVPCEEFPGGHVAYQTDPEGFTARLTAILDGFAA
ncbi:alpha/beta hydrolase [Nonomuraea sp. NPDC000554]|uniref:alpha/beta fold hydrolase n=1 Tax=Nonomuraea sp. NPDC000554 TaxID=3154259 RepID=UPI0033249207